MNIIGPLLDDIYKRLQTAVDIELKLNENIAHNIVKIYCKNVNYV